MLSYDASGLGRAKPRRKNSRSVKWAEETVMAAVPLHTESAPSEDENRETDNPSIRRFMRRDSVDGEPSFVSRVKAERMTERHDMQRLYRRKLTTSRDPV